MKLILLLFLARRVSVCTIIFHSISSSYLIHSLLGQPMTIAYEMKQPRRAVSAPHSSLINRIQKPPLADRLSSDDSQIRDSSGPYVLFHCFTLARPSNCYASVDPHDRNPLVAAAEAPTEAATIMHNVRMFLKRRKSWIRN